MENLFTQSLLKKALTASKIKGQEETQELNITPKGNSVEKVGQIDHPEILMVSSNDNATINGKDVDVFGSLDDEIIINKFDKGFSTLGADIIKKMKTLIWDLHNPKNPTNPVDPDNPVNPDDPIVPDKPDDPADDNLDGTGRQNEELPSDITLKRGDAPKTATFGSKETVLTLKDPYGGANYQYKISSTNGSNVTGTFEFLPNGRLVVTGNYLKIEALGNQKDDLIIMGHYNNINTGDCEDIVRVGLVGDANYEHYLLTSYQNGAETWSVGDTSFYTAVGNKINTGSGDDYVYMFGNNYNIDTGSGNDKVQIVNDNIEMNHIQNSELTRVHETKGYLDGLDGWTTQGDEGDCRLLAIINSFCGNNNKGEISKFAQIKTNGSNYEITFPNYIFGTNKVTITANEVSNYSGATGDLDTILVDMAMNKLIAINKDFGDTSVETAHYNTISRYLTGSSETTYIQINGGNDPQNNISGNINHLIDLWNKYQRGEISNLGVGINYSDYRTGVCGGHAYSIKNLDINAGYIEVVNPWDDADILKYSIEELLTYGVDLVVYGKDLYNGNWLIPNGGNLTRMDGTQTPSSNTLTTPYYGNTQNNHEAEKTNPFSNIYNITEGDETELMKELQTIEENVNNAKSLIQKRKTTFKLS